MPTFSNITHDVQWAVSLATGGLTIYTTYPSALAAAVALSAGNANAPVYLMECWEQNTAPTSGPARTEMPGQGGPAGIPSAGDCQLWAVQLVSGTYYYPLETARAQAYALSTANSGVPVYIYRPYETVTAP